MVGDEMGDIGDVVSLKRSPAAKGERQLRSTDSDDLHVLIYHNITLIYHRSSFGFLQLELSCNQYTLSEISCVK